MRINPTIPILNPNRGKIELSNSHEYKERTRVLILDTSSFIMGVDPFGLSGRLVTSDDVINEVKKQYTQTKIQTALELGRLECKAPAPEYVNSVKKICRSSGDSAKLSRTDISVLALALELKAAGLEPTIVSDDYAIQNVAEILNIPYETVSTRGIRSRIKWRFFCSGCGRKFDTSPNERKCPDCGSYVKLRPIAKTATRKILSEH